MVFAVFFRSPEDAAAPVVYSAASADMGSSTARYMHLMRFKDPSELAMDPQTGARLWDKSEMLLKELRDNR